MKKWNFRNNLICLREANKESQENLAYNLGFRTKSTIANYEAGDRTPNHRILQKIAIHYNITVDELCYGDLKYLIDKDLTDFPIDDWRKNKKISEIMFPVWGFKKDKYDDPLFERGYEAQKKIRKYFYKDETSFDSKMFKTCHDSYIESVNENGTIESAANLLWLYVFVSSIWNNKHLLGGIYKLYSKQIDKKEFHKDYILKCFLDEKSNEDEAYTKKEGFVPADRELKILEKYVEKDEEVYALLFRCLRKNSQGCEFADYYMALQYILNLVDNDYDAAMNQVMGMELMRKFVIMGNKYAIEFFEIFDKEALGE